MGSYAVEHASALADVMAAGARVTFTAPDAAAYSPRTDTFGTPNMSTVSGYAIRVKGNPRVYERLSLIQSESPALLFVPDTYGAVAPLDSTVTWSGRTWTVKDVATISPDGTSIAQEIVITGGASANLTGTGSTVFTYAITAAGGLVFTAAGGVSPAFAVAALSDYNSLAFRYQPGDSLAAATFTRISSKTQIDVNGNVHTVAPGVAADGHYINGVRTLLMESQRTTLLTFSQDFSNAAWVLADTPGGTLTPNTADTTAPDTTQTGNKFVATGGGAHVWGKFQSFTYTAASYTLSIFAKQGTYNALAIDFSNAGNAGAVFNLNTGVVGFTNVGITASMTPLGNGWYRCAITGARTAVASFPEWYLSGSGTANTRLWAAAGTESVYTWGADLDLALFAESYIATTTTAVTRATDALSFLGVQAGVTATLFQRYYDLATAAFVDAVSAYTSGTTITPTVDRAYQTLAVLRGSYSAGQAAAILGVP